MKLKKITTKSGTVYEYDEEKARIRRTGDVPIITYGPVFPVNNVWYRVLTLDLAEGEGLYSLHSDGTWFSSTPVVSIEEVE